MLVFVRAGLAGGTTYEQCGTNLEWDWVKFRHILPWSRRRFRWKLPISEISSGGSAQGSGGVSEKAWTSGVSTSADNAPYWAGSNNAFEAGPPKDNFRMRRHPGAIRP